MCLFFRCTIINVEMHFTFAIRVGDELSRLMEHLLVLLDELRQKLTEIILREAYNQECSNDNINGDTIRAVERPVEFLHAIIMQLSFFVADVMWRTTYYARIDAEMKRKVFEEKVPNFTPNTTMPWEEDKDLLQWLTQFGKKSF